MTYDRNSILKTLSSAPLYEGMEFHEGKNKEFFNSMGENFSNIYSYAHGATKFVLIPLDQKIDYVIKIPYTGLYECESGYYTDTFYQPGFKDYFEFCAADDENCPWDYCASEVYRYKIAEEEGFSHCFAKTEFLGYINNYPIYIQEKCTTLSNSRNSHRHSEEEKDITSKVCGARYYDICADWLTDFRLYYNNEFLIDFITFVHSMQWDDDLRNENIGYINNRPVLIDYSGFLD